MFSLSLQLLGPSAISYGGEPLSVDRTSDAWALLIYLACQSAPHRRENLITHFWPDTPEIAAHDLLQQALDNLQQTIPQVIDRNGDGAVRFLLADHEIIQINPHAAYDLDIDTFEKRINGPQVGWPEAVSLYRGEFLVDISLPHKTPYSEWVVVRRARLKHQVLQALELLSAAAVEEGDLALIERFAWQQLDIDNLSESAYRQLMIVLARSGQRSAALAQYEVYRKRLDEKSGIEPGAEISELYRRIQADELQQTMIRRPPARPPETATINPIFCYTDIESSTRLWDEHREAMLLALIQHNELAETEIEHFDGRILHPTGDGFLIVFEQNDPLQFAIALQKRFAEADWGEIGELRIRIGLHGATAGQEGHDFFREGDWYRGSVLNHAARIADTGHGGQIVTSAMVKEYCPLPPGATWEDLGEHNLKSLDDVQQIYGLRHPDLQDQSFPPLRTPANKRATAYSEGRIRGYDLGQQIGQGAFGVVHRAHQPAVGREVAIKIILPQYANHPDFIRRFEAEAQTVARLEHPYIVPLYDYWREPDGAFLVMRWLRGGSLQSSLVQGPWEPGAAARLLDQIAGALASAHRQGVVHRDIKPANILLDEEGNGYLSDFGIAKDVTLDAGLTETGAMVGSPAYISPEQVLNEEITSLTDIYSLGIVLYELLTSQHPYSDAHAGALLNKQLNEPLPLVSKLRPELPDGLDEVIQRATAKNPAERYVDALALAEAFRNAAGGIEDLEVIPAAELVNPYKGLRPFREADAADFFGRETLVRELLERLAPNKQLTAPAGNGLGLASASDGRFLTVVGPSGSGKSSVVKAGVVPALRQGAVDGSQNWFIVEVMPGSHPLEELEAGLLRIAVNPPQSLLGQMKEDPRGLLRAVKRVLPDEEDELLLVVDQFEELFTLVEDKAEQQLFMDSLCEAALDPRSRVHVVLTLRADFYDRPLSYPAFGELVRQNTTAIVPLTNDELGSAVCAPAERAGAIVAPELLTTIINDVSQQPGALPLLQYALTELFERRKGRTMTLAAYEEMGGVNGALGRRAEEIFTSLDADGQEATRQLFLRLVTLGEGVEDTRRRVSRFELEAVNRMQGGIDAADPKMDFGSTQIGAVIDAFGYYRLLTFDRDPATRGPTVEVAHEALLREWERLRGWLEESRDDVRWQRRLAASAAEWYLSGQDEGFLLRGSRLEQFDGWSASATIALTQNECSYLDASVKAREMRQNQEDARRRRELETAQQLAETERQRAEDQAQAAGLLRRRAFVLAGALGIAAILAIVAIFFARQSNQNAAAAQDNAYIAATREAEAATEAEQRAVAQAQAENERQNAQRQAAILLAGQAETELENGYYDRAVLLAMEALQNYPYNSQAERALGRAVSYNRALQQCPGHGSAVAGLSWSPDGDRFASISSIENQVLVWDASSCQELLSIDLPRGITGNMLDMGMSVEWTPDGTGLLTMTGDRYLVGSQDYDLLLWDAQSGERLTTVELPNHTEAEVPGATSSFTHFTTGAAADFDPHSQRLATIGGDNTAVIWDESNQAPVLTLSGHENDVNSVAWAPDGLRLATASLDGTARVWDAETGAELLLLKEHADRVNQAVWSPNGELLATGGYDGKACIWDAHNGELLKCLDDNAGAVWSLTWLADNTRLATGHEDSGIRIWDSQTEQPLQILRGHENLISYLSHSPVDDKLVSGDGSGQVRIWNVAASTAEQPMPYGSLNGQFDITNDGRYVALPIGDNAFLTADPQLVIWDLESGQPVIEGLTTDPNYYWVDVKYSPDSKMILAFGTGIFPDFAPANTAYVFDAQSGDLLKTFKVDGDNFHRSMAWSPDGSQVGTGRFHNGGVTVWDFETGEIAAQLVADSPRQFNMTSFLEWSPDGTKLAAANEDSAVRVWDTEQWELLFKVEHDPPTASWYTRWSPDGSRLLSAAGNDETGAQDMTARVWDSQTGEQLLVIQGHTRQVTSADWSPDGTRIATTSGDGTTRLWDAESGEELLSLDTPNLFIGYLVWSNNGHDLVVGGTGLAPAAWRVWQSTEELIAYAQECCVYRELTADEREQYGLDDIEY